MRRVQLLVLLIVIAASAFAACRSELQPSFESDPPATFRLAVVTTGNGLGVVSSAPSGIQCPTDCEEYFEEGTQVTLQVIGSSERHTLASWQGDCAGQPPACALDMTANRVASATIATSGTIVTRVVFGAGYDEEIRALEVHPSGDVVLGGVLSGPTGVLAGGLVCGTSLSGNGTTQGLLVRLRPDGSCVWGKAFGGPQSDGVEALALAPDGQTVTFAGFFSTVLEIDELTASATASLDGMAGQVRAEDGVAVELFAHATPEPTPTPKPNEVGRAACYLGNEPRVAFVDDTQNTAPSDNRISLLYGWPGAPQYRNTGLVPDTNGADEEPVAVTALGDLLYLAGNHNDSFSWPGGPTLTHAGDDIADFFLARLTSNGGTVVWVFSSETNGFQRVKTVTSGPGRIAIAGRFDAGFTPTTTFFVPPLPPVIHPAVPNVGGNSCGYVIVLDSSGFPVRTHVLGGTNFQGVEDVALRGRLVAATGGADPYDLLLENGAFPTMSGGSRNVFIAMLDSAGGGRWVKSFGSALQDEGTALAFDPFGYLWVAGTLGTSGAMIEGVSAPAFGGRDAFLLRIAP